VLNLRFSPAPASPRTSRLPPGSQGVHRETLPRFPQLDQVGLVMFWNSMSRHRRRGWRYLLGLSLLGFLIIASASDAAPVHSSGSKASATPFMQ
jgi:hypothetical protein